MFGFGKGELPEEEEVVVKEEKVVIEGGDLELEEDVELESGDQLEVVESGINPNIINKDPVTNTLVQEVDEEAANDIELAPELELEEDKEEKEDEGHDPYDSAKAA